MKSKKKQYYKKIKKLVQKNSKKNSKKNKRIKLFFYKLSGGAGTSNDIIQHEIDEVYKVLSKKYNTIKNKKREMKYLKVNGTKSIIFYCNGKVWLGIKDTISEDLLKTINSNLKNKYNQNNMIKLINNNKQRSINNLKVDTSLCN